MLPQYCDGIDRRGFLRLGSLAGISLADVLRLQHAHGAEGVAKKDVNCIFIFYHWGDGPSGPVGSEARGSGGNSG